MLKLTSFLILISLAFFILSGCEQKSKMTQEKKSEIINGKADIAKRRIQTVAQTKQIKVRSTLVIPPLLKDTNPDPDKATFELTAQKGKHSFFSNIEVDTLGYNGNYLGPTIRAKKGQQVNIRVKNRIGEDTTVHWHGMHVPAEMDGGPRQIIKANSEWNVTFPIKQQAATLWYHPHLLGKTGEHVYKGLAGLFILDDEESEKLNIPKTYGVDDIPLIVQDKRFYQDGSIPYSLHMHDLMNGFAGNRVVVNGVLRPTLNVKNVKMRFRLLNGSNAAVFIFTLSDDNEFHQIASDGGFLPKPVKMTRLQLSSGERGEIIVDFAKYSLGSNLKLQLISARGKRYDLITFSVVEKTDDKSKIPDKLVNINRIPESSADKTRTFIMETMPGMGRGAGMGMGMMAGGNRLAINNKKMDINRIDEKVKLDSTEVWTVINRSPGMFAHNFHVHDVQFQILAINGALPPENERGWKDTVLLWPNDNVKLIAKFEDYTGIYMYHCHILEHEDDGMMGQFEVIN